MRFEKATFVTSALLPGEFPKRKLPEIVLAGRSNVGKSSLINTLFQTKTIAKTSSTPGKTQRINFFLVDDSAFLVDLPGYGFATAPKEEIMKWSQGIDDYLNQSETLRLILLLIDIRRQPSKEDLALAEWAAAKKVPLLVVFTKRDKLSDSEAEKSMKESLSLLPKVADALLFSNRNFHERRNLIQKMAVFMNSSLGSSVRGKARLKQSGPNNKAIAEGAMAELEDQSGKAAAGRNPDEFMKAAKTNEVIR